METHGAQYQVARDGKVLGVYTLRGVVEQLESRRITLNDHYWTEGMTDWLPLSNLSTVIDETLAHLAEERLREEQARERGQRNPEQPNDTVPSAEDARLKELYAPIHGPKPWICHTCSREFPSDGKAKPRPYARGILLAMACILLGLFLFAGLMQSRTDPFVSIVIMASIVALAFVALGAVIGFGVESGLHQFHSHRPCCPNCSSPYCSKIPDRPPS